MSFPTTVHSSSCAGPSPGASGPRRSQTPDPGQAIPETLTSDGDRAARLPELDTVYWRRPVDETALRRSARLWTATTVAHSLPFVAAAVLLAVMDPITIPVGLILLAHAWVIPELYASRGAGVLRAKHAKHAERETEAAAERRAVGLLGDLVGHEARELHSRTSLVLEPGRLGAWLIGEAGAVLVRPGARRVLCYCVKVPDPELPRGDRIAHLVLALREDEAGFATVANVAFCGARWRLRRRLSNHARAGLDRAALAARTK